MPYCETHEFYDEIVGLLEKLAYTPRPLSTQEHDRLRDLLDRWDAIECPEAGCVPGQCPFARPVVWAEYFGYRTLYDLVERLDHTRPIKRIPRWSGVDALLAKGKRRPGHYNP
jgi:hypothetical protein